MYGMKKKQNQTEQLVHICGSRAAKQPAAPLIWSRRGARSTQRIPHTMADNKLAAYFISVAFTLRGIPRRMREWRILGVEGAGSFSWPTRGLEVFGAHPWHIQTYQGADCTRGLRLPTPSQFDILNNYWICHQTKLSDTKSCVNLWLLPPKLCMTRWIIHGEEVEEEEDDGQIRKEKERKKKQGRGLKIKQWARKWNKKGVKINAV